MPSVDPIYQDNCPICKRPISTFLEQWGMELIPEVSATSSGRRGSLVYCSEHCAQHSIIDGPMGMTGGWIRPVKLAGKDHASQEFRPLHVSLTASHNININWPEGPVVLGGHSLTTKEEKGKDNGQD